MFRESSPVSRQSYFRECPAFMRKKVAKAGLATHICFSVTICQGTSSFASSACDDAKVEGKKIKNPLRRGYA